MLAMDTYYFIEHVRNIDPPELVLKEILTGEEEEGDTNRRGRRRRY